MYNFENAKNSIDLANLMLKYRDDLASEYKIFGGLEFVNAYSSLTDSLILRIYEIALEEIEHIYQNIRKDAAMGLSIAAVGGYGRQEMSPFSDIDVAFIVGSDENDEIDSLVKRAFRYLMDTIDSCGLKVGYSYRRINDVENLPLEAQTALLDSRRICGSFVMFKNFESALRTSIKPAAFVINHIKQRKKLHNGDSLYAVEPNVKEGCGGLRDLQTARWISEITFGFSGEKIWESLRSRGIINDSDINKINSAIEYMHKIRNISHITAKRSKDVLSTGRHLNIARELEYEGTDEKCVRQFVKDFYKQSTTIRNVYEKVADACLDSSLEIEPGIICRSGKLVLTDKGLLKRDNSAIIRIFGYAQEYNLKIDRETREIISDESKTLKLERDAAKCFLEIVRSSGVGGAIRSMSELGVLGAIIPAFNDLLYCISGDAAHKFTVGEHSLQVVENLEQLFSESGEVLTDVLSRIQNLDILFLAGLLHDLGKLDSHKDHCKTGAVRVAKIGFLLGLDEDSCDKLESLVRHHLRMSETARLRDMNQRKTIRDFVSVIKDLQFLDMLFLLTIADSRSIGSKNWSQVHDRFLSELHERAASALRSPETGIVDIERHRKRVSRELCLTNLAHDEVELFCASMPASYLLNTSPEELACHIGFAGIAKEGSIAVDLKDDRAGQYTELTVVSGDKQGLLNNIAGVLSALGVDIHAAQIYTSENQPNIAIDKIFVDFEGRQLTEIKKLQIESELTAVLSMQYSVEELMKRCGKDKRKKPENIKIFFHENQSEHESVIEIRTSDISGLLYYLTRKISSQGWDIHSARVATWGHEARDVFYVTKHSGEKLNQADIEDFLNVINLSE